jgi:hypothetical protein
LSSEKNHAGHFGRWVIGEAQAAAEAEVVKKAEDVYGELATGKGTRSMAQTPEDAQRAAENERNRLAELANTDNKATSLAEQIAARVLQQQPQQPTAPAELDPDQVLAALASITGRPVAHVRQFVGAMMMGTPPGAAVAAPATTTAPRDRDELADAEAEMRRQEEEELRRLDAEANAPLPGAQAAMGRINATDVATPAPVATPSADANGNQVADEKETVGGYLRVAEFGTVLQAQPELLDRLLELELGRADKGRKSAFQAIHAAELVRDGGPRADVLAVVEPRI